MRGNCDDDSKSPPGAKNPQDSVRRSYYLKMHGSGFANSIVHVSVGFGEILTFKLHFGYPYNDLREEKIGQFLFHRVAIRSA
jgi:hypothetical protein